MVNPVPGCEWWERSVLQVLKNSVGRNSPLVLCRMRDGGEGGREPGQKAKLELKAKRKQAWLLWSCTLRSQV